LPRPALRAVEAGSAVRLAIELDLSRREPTRTAHFSIVLPATGEPGS
jgi:hypothetical protein